MLPLKFITTMFNRDTGSLSVNPNPNAELQSLPSYADHAKSPKQLSALAQTKRRCTTLLILQALGLGSILIFSSQCSDAFAAAEGEKMSRPQQAQATIERLFNQNGSTYQSDLSKTDPELAQIEENLVYGELFYQGSLTDKQRILVLLSSMVTTQNLDDLRNFVQAGLNLNIEPAAIKEAVYQCAPYVGLGKVKAALKVVNEVFAANKIELPLPSQSQVNEDNRFAKGKEAQVSTFGDAIEKMHQSTKEEQKYLIVDHLSAYCFGDIFTRKGLSHQERELIIFAAILSLGGADSQVKSHAQGNLAVGNTSQNLFDVAALLMPYIGFPRTLNAVAAVNQL